MGTIGFIGAGNMAEALIKGIINAKLYQPKDILVSDIRKERLDLIGKEYGVTSAKDNSDLAGGVNTLVLSVKPQNMADVVKGIKDAVRGDCLVISIMAGVRIAKISSVLGDIAIVRVMPNTPALIGEGASALFANDRAKSLMVDATQIFSAVGRTVIVDNEDLIDAVTAVSGSGPAYFFALMEEMIKAANGLGLSEDTAKTLVLQTAKGAALLAVERDKFGESPAELRRKVTSPGGTTEAALKVFSAREFGQIIEQALTAACDRSKELAGGSKK